MNKTTEKNNKSPKKYIGLALVILGVVFGILILPNLFQPKPKVDFSSIENICELATQKNIYHNTITIDKEGNLLEELLLKKHYWVEYKGNVESGVDASKIKISDPDKDGIVEVFIPDAQVLNVNVDIDSMSDPITDDGILDFKFFKAIKAKDKVQAFATAQEAMRQSAEQDEYMLKSAKKNAMNLIEQYIISIGKGVGRDLTVKWVSY